MKMLKTISCVLVIGSLAAVLVGCDLGQKEHQREMKNWSNKSTAKP
jgi:hypothetical protein